jgi:hypothetical protein
VKAAAKAPAAAGELVRLGDCVATDVIMLPDGRRCVMAWPTRDRTNVDVVDGWCVRFCPGTGPRGEPEWHAADTIVRLLERAPVVPAATAVRGDVDPLLAGAAAQADIDPLLGGGRR